MGYRNCCCHRRHERRCEPSCTVYYKCRRYEKKRCSCHRNHH